MFATYQRQKSSLENEFNLIKSKFVCLVRSLLPHLAFCLLCRSRSDIRQIFNPLPNDKFLDITKLKAIADNKLNIAEMMISPFDSEEKTVGKEENAGSQYKSFENTLGKRRNCSLQAISPFPTVFSILSDNFQPFSPKSKLLSANSFSLEESKICHLGKGFGKGLNSYNLLWTGKRPVCMLYIQYSSFFILLKNVKFIFVLT